MAAILFRPKYVKSVSVPPPHLIHNLVTQTKLLFKKKQSRLITWPLYEVDRLASHQSTDVIETCTEVFMDE